MPVLAALEPEKAILKHHLVYTARTFSPGGNAAAPMRPPLRLLCVGRLLCLKGFQYAVEAVSLLAAQGVKTELTIAGSGLWKYPLRRLARRLGVEKRVHFPGFVPHDEVTALMLASDMLLMPSIVLDKGRSDSLPTVIVEAMSLGLPVIGSDIASFGDVIRQGESGLLTPERDAAALARAVRRLAENREEALGMAARAKNLVRELFDPAANLSRLERLFTEHAGASGPHLP
jgi:glycosyltransferase involved in cell wall biosynthesis